MTIGSLSEQQFIAILNEHLRPSKPTDTEEHLFDREKQLNQIKQAFYSPGRQIFIWGDRGVGKTSLAQTAAHLYHPADSAPVFVACGEHTSFASIVNAIAVGLSAQYGDEEAKKTTKWTFDAKLVKHEAGKETTAPVRQAVNDINSAVAALRHSVAHASSRAVVVVDEFDLLTSHEDQRMFGELIKQLADQSINLVLIFCGVGTTLDELLHSHNSAYRYIESIELPRLTYTGRWQIVDACADALGVEVNADSRFRISAISDGFPHYVHLVCEKLFWTIFEAKDAVLVATPEHYMEAVNRAVVSIEQHLKQAYEKATLKYKDEYQEVLWALADHFELKRNTQQIYESYKRVMKQRGGEPLDIRFVSQRLNALKSDRCGHILTSKQRSWFEFRESIVRGYVRLRAENEKVRLALEHH